MAESKKYYWLKLNRGFFKRHDVRIIEAINYKFVLFYMKLLTESIDHEGYLRFSEAKPYNNEMLAVVTNTSVDVVRQAMEMFVDLGVVEILEDETIYMVGAEKLIGSETDVAERMRRSRSKKKSEMDSVTNCYTDVTQCYTDVTNCYTEIDKDKEKKTDTEEEKNVCEAPPKKKPPKHKYGSEKNVLLTDDEYRKLQEKFPDCDERIENMSVAIAIHGYKYNSHYLAILNWASKDNKQSKQEKSNNPFLDMLQNGG